MRRNGEKMKKKMVCALAAGMMLCLAGCGATKEEQAQDMPVMSATQEQSGKAAATPKPTPTPEPFQYDLEVTDERKFLENTDLFTDMSFTVEDKTVAMPCKYSDLIDAGFFLVDYYGSETTVEEYIEYGAGLDENGMTFNLHDLNVKYRLSDGTEWEPYICGYVTPQGELVSFMELDYTSFIFDNQYAMGSGLFNDFTVGNSIAQVFLGEDYKEVLEDYGDPTMVWIQDGTGLAELTYYTEKDANGNSYSMSVKLMNGKVESISYQCF